MQKQRLVIVGNGMAAGRLLDKLITLAKDRYQITVVGDEAEASYNRIMLSAVLSGEQTAKQIMTHTNQWYQQHQIELITNDAVVTLDCARQRLTTQTGKTIPYDRLVLATGSRPLLPALSATELRQTGVKTFRTLADVGSIQQHAHNAKHAVVIGGGLLGLEAAHGLNEQGRQVTVVHRAKGLLNRQLDSTAAELLRNDLQRRGIQFELDCEVSQMTDNESGELQQLQLSNGKTLDCTLAVISIGIQPNTDLAQQAGLAFERGIIVDPYMRTSDSDIYALGECCQFQQHTFGLVAPIWQQVDTLVQHLADESEVTEYRVKAVATKLKVSGIDLFSAGDVETDDEHQVQHYHDYELGHYRKLLFKDNRLTGAVLYGDVGDGNDYFELIQTGQDISSLRPWLMFGLNYAHKQAEQFPQTDSEVLSPTALPPADSAHNSANIPPSLTNNNNSLSDRYRDRSIP